METLKEPQLKNKIKTFRKLDKKYVQEFPMLFEKERNTWLNFLMNDFTKKMTHTKSNLFKRNE